MLEAGRALRAQVPRRSHGRWTASPGRPDPLEILSRSNATRLPELVPVRNGRMMASPFAFYRGSPAVMAADLSRTPSTGIVLQICGDAHLHNFGTFATPERNQVFDLNDFDETQPGPWEWDIKRLAASLVVAARTAGLSDGERQGRGAGLFGGVSQRDGEDGAAVGLRGVALPSGRRVDNRRRSRQAGPFPCRKDRGQGPPAHQPAERCPSSRRCATAAG